MSTPLGNTDMCCPEFNVSKWDNITHQWNNKPFIKDSVRQIFHIPIDMGKVITRMFKKVEDAKASPITDEFLVLAFDPSPWKSELYMSVTKEVPNAENVTLSGRFVSKVYDGAYNQVPMWIKDMDLFLDKKGLKAKKYYFHYAYCPKCSKKYGHNYCIAFAEV